MVAFLESQCVITRMLLKRNLLLALFQRDAVKRRGAQKKKKKRKSEMLGDVCDTGAALSR